MKACDILKGQLKASDVLKAGAPVGNRNAAGPHKHGIGSTLGSAASSPTARMSQSAAEASKLAEGSGNPMHHREAANLHGQAGNRHYQEANKCYEHGGKDGLARFHELKSEQHFQAMREHSEIAKAGAASLSDLKRSRTASDFPVEESDASTRKTHEKFNASDASPSDAIRARSASDVIYAGATAQFPVTASAKPWATGEPVEFMYMPAGKHTICAGFRSASIKLTVDVDPSDAARVLQGSLEQLRASQPKQMPFGCVEHEEKDASVWAKGFTAKEDGVYLCAEPSELGARHVNGRIHRSWSPSFLTDADYSKARLEDGTYVFPEGVRGSESNPAKITGCAFCLGTLTNKPAFREMSPVKAREAVQASVVGQVHNPQGHNQFTEQNEVSREVAKKLSKAAGQHSEPYRGYRHNLGNGKAIVAHPNGKFYHIDASEQGNDSAIHAADPTSPSPFDASALLDVARALRVAHWNADTKGTEHEALGELYDSWEDGMDQLVEALCGKRGCKVAEEALGNSELAEQALAALAGVKVGLDCEADADLCNIVADMENSVNKGRYLLKAKENGNMQAKDVLKAARGGQPGNQNAAGPHTMHHTQLAYAHAKAEHDALVPRVQEAVAKLQPPSPDASEADWLAHYTKEGQVEDAHGLWEAKDKLRKSEEAMVSAAKEHMERQPIYRNRKAEVESVWTSGMKRPNTRAKLVDAAFRLNHGDGVQASSREAVTASSIMRHSAPSGATAQPGGK